MRKITCLFFFLLSFTLTKAQVPDQSWWTFSYPVNHGSDSSLLDLRYLNERFAGEHGFIRLSKDGNSFANGQNHEVRFWACNGGSLASGFDDKKLDSLARFLAKMGVNLIRYHGAINPKGKNTKITDVDTTEARNIWRCVAAMKKQGIYTVISPYWASNGHMGGWIPKEWGIDGYSGETDMWGVIFFNDKLKNAYKAWVKYLYTIPNPYTGVALKDESAVAVIQVENEDSDLFWTMSAIKPELAKMIGAQYSRWLKNKYGTTKVIKDTMALLPMYELTLPPGRANQQQVDDQVAFFADAQRSFYDDMVHYYRDILGCKQLINGSNWRTASQSRLLDLERWTNSGADVIAVNKYFDPQHKGPNDGWRVDPGDFYGAPSALKNPADLPTNLKHVDGHPMMVTESGWNLPNKYQTEGPLLVAAYGGLTGLNTFFWFTPTAVNYAQLPYFTFLNIQGQHPMNRWTTSTPGEMGMFPANALIQRLGYVQEGHAVAEERTMSSMLSRSIPPIFEEQPFDPNRDFVQRNNNDERKLSALTFLTGKVSTTYRAKKDTVKLLADLQALIDTKNSKIRSVTGQQLLNYRDGLFTLNTPKAKAVTGFLNTQKAFKLSEVTIKSDNDYATIELVSMDGLNLDRSKKILLQVGTVFRPTGWKEEPATITDDHKQLTGFKILNTGTMPWLGMPAKGSISLKNKAIKKAIQLDVAGYAIKQLNITHTTDGISLQLPTDTYYILLEN
ncbi:hypothetical protein FO440_04145 [Mucilaginibacter corticis]|uniref:Glycoside hydrolase family 42 N-terminal domain-containing protein n=1 Tax=Mucilaginibacter corticis TaxID=2597670 RepID=A0A556MU90_9SPHI|nr:hypothetical protein [Mucilaginibacter corticis]TSJ43392.1 hypothetical protein FO440_04145 [Mucilaginibacter corticis]